MEESKEKLIREFEELKSLELEAAHLYKNLLPLITDSTDAAVLTGIVKDEHRHADIAQEIIDIIKSA